MTHPITTCPQCKEVTPTITRYERTTEDGKHIEWRYSFDCCGEPLAAWGYPEEWGEQRFEEQGGDE